MNGKNTATSKSSPQKLTDEAKKAIEAMNRAHEKLRARKRALGQKLVVSQNGKIVTIDA